MRHHHNDRAIFKVHSIDYPLYYLNGQSCFDSGRETRRSTVYETRRERDVHQLIEVASETAFNQLCALCAACVCEECTTFGYRKVSTAIYNGVIIDWFFFLSPLRFTRVILSAHIRQQQRPKADA